MINNDKMVFIGIAVFVVFVLVFVFLFVLKKTSNKKTTTSQSGETQKPKLSELDSMIYIVSQENVSEDEIAKTVENFIRTQRFEKKSSNPSEICKKQLDFITKLASNKSATAKIIARLNMGLKKNNPEYYKEIEMYEAIGLMRRK